MPQEGWVSVQAKAQHSANKGQLFFISFPHVSSEWVRFTNEHVVLQERYDLCVCRQDVIRP